MYTVGPEPKSISSEPREIHSIPCKLFYTGPADVKGNFVREVSENGEMAIFRGRGLEGSEWKAPDGFEIHVLKERKGPRGQILDIETKTDKLQIWEWDRTCGENANRTVIAKATAYLKIAESLLD